MLFSNDWLGGINYFNNLFNAVNMLPDNRIHFTIFTGYKIDDTRFKMFPKVNVVKSKIFDQFTMPWFCRKLILRLINKDWMLERLLKKHGIKLLSHSGIIGDRATIPTISWIPDFQHLHLPAFFSEKELARRDQNFKSYIKWSTIVLLSSHDALKDLIRFNNQNVPKARVLNFVVNPSALTNETTTLNLLNEKYRFTGRYFLLPNQFWAHKNHRVVIDALAELKRRNVQVLILATGNTEDNRNPDFFSELQNYIQKLGVEEDFRILGIVPLSDLYALMLHSDAVINPSLFEGWSTTVEEAKTLNKRILMSDIAVHREQSPQRGLYFKPDDAKTLADLIHSVALSDNHEPDKINDLSVAMKNFQNFGTAYQKLVIDLTNHE